MDRFVCHVVSCLYLATGAIDDVFHVCLIHDRPATRKMLAKLQRPSAWWVVDHFPIIMPCGELREEHLKPRPAGPTTICASEDPWLARIPEGHSKHAHPDFDLSRDD